MFFNRLISAAEAALCLCILCRLRSSVCCVDLSSPSRRIFSCVSRSTCRSPKRSQGQHESESESSLPLVKLTFLGENIEGGMDLPRPLRARVLFCTLRGPGGRRRARPGACAVPLLGPPSRLAKLWTPSRPRSARPCARTARSPLPICPAVSPQVKCKVPKCEMWKGECQWARVGRGLIHPCLPLSSLSLSLSEILSYPI